MLNTLMIFVQDGVVFFPIVVGMHSEFPLAHTLSSYLLSHPCLSIIIISRFSPPIHILPVQQTLLHFLHTNAVQFQHLFKQIVFSYRFHDPPPSRLRTNSFCSPIKTSFQRFNDKRRMKGSDKVACLYLA